MSPRIRRRMIKSVAIAAGGFLLAGTGFLLIDHMRAQRAAAQSQTRLNELRLAIKKDASTAKLLDDESKRVTEQSLRRDRRRRITGWAMVGIASMFVLCVKWLIALRPFPYYVPEAVLAKQARDVLARSAGVPPRPAGDGSFPGQLVQLRMPAARIDTGPIDRIVGKVGRERESAIPILQAIQSHYRYLPEAALRRACEISKVTPAQMAGLATFYAQFRHRPVGEHILKMCHGTACHVAGAQLVTDELRRHLSIPADSDTDAAKRFTIEEVACLGCCSLAPVLMIDEKTCGRLTLTTARESVDGELQEATA